MEYDTLEKTVRLIPTYRTGPWALYELEPFVKTYNIARFIEQATPHNESAFWRNVSQRLYRLGIYRDADACKDQVRCPYKLLCEHIWKAKLIPGNMRFSSSRHVPNSLAATCHNLFI